MSLTEKEFYNSHKILNIIKENTNYRIYQDEVFDDLFGMKIKVFYLKFDCGKIRISLKEFKQLKEMGIKEIII